MLSNDYNFFITHISISSTNRSSICFIKYTSSWCKATIAFWGEVLTTCRRASHVCNWIIAKLWANFLCIDIFQVASWKNCTWIINKKVRLLILIFQFIFIFRKKKVLKWNEQSHKSVAFIYFLIFRTRIYFFCQ